MTAPKGIARRATGGAAVVHRGTAPLAAAWLAAAGCASFARLDPRSLPGAQQHPGEHAIFLADEGDVRFVPDARLGSPVLHGRFRVQARLLTQKGLEDFQSVSLHYQREGETLDGVRARVVRPDGTSTSLGGADIADVSTTGAELHSDGRARVLDFSKAACIGCVVEYRWETTSTLHQVPFRWHVAGEHLTLLSRLTVHLSPGQELEYALVQGRERGEPHPRETPEAGGGRALAFEWRDTKLPPGEPFAPPDGVRAPVLRYALRADAALPGEARLFRTWDDLGRWFHALWASRLAPSPELEALGASLAAGADSPREKLRRLYDHVRSRIRYEAVEYGLGGWQPRMPSFVVSAGYGDCKDKAALLVALARTQGVEAHPVLLGTRDRLPPVQPSPHLALHNHAVAVAFPDGSPVFLDPTCRDCPMGALPWSDEGVPVVILRGAEAELSRTPEGIPADSRIERTSEVALEPDGSATVAFSARGVGQAGAWIRGALRNRNPRELDDLARTLAVLSAGSATPVSREARDPDDDSRPAGLDARLQVRGAAMREPGGTLVVRPSRLLGHSFPLLPAEDRRLPVHLEERWLQVSRLRVTLPAGWTAEALPAPFELSTPLAVCTLSYRPLPGGFELERTYAALQAWMELPAAREFGTSVRACRQAENRAIVVRPAAPASPPAAAVPGGQP